MRNLCALGEPGPAPRLVLLDIPDGGAFYAADEGAAADAAGVRAFLAAYAAKTLAPASSLAAAEASQDEAPCGLRTVKAVCKELAA